MKSANHNIQKVFLEVDTRTSKKAYYLKDTIDDFLKEHLFPFLEDYFNSLTLDTNANYQLKDLQLSLSVKEHLKIEDMIPTLKKQLDQVFFSEKREELISQSSISFHKLSETENKINTLLYFLEHGTYPWWVENSKKSNQSVEALLYDCIESKIFIKAFKQKLNNTTFRERTILQISDVFLSLLVLKINSEAKKTTLSFIKSNRFLNDISKVSKQAKQFIWNLLIEFSIGKKINTKYIEQKYADLVKKRASIAISEDKTIVQIIEKLIKKNIIHDFSFNDSKDTKEKERKDEDAFNTITEKDHITRKIIDEASFLEADKDDLSTKDIKPSEKLPEKENSLQKEQTEISSKSQTLDFSKNKETLSDDEKVTIQKNDSVKQEGVFYVENAGLILLHPFLKSFFEKCEILDESNSIKNPPLAIHLLHYLATGKEKQFEHLQIFEKFLCNIPIQHPINREISINDELKANADELLKAVLNHLPKLKSSSVGLFQNEFLQRPGKLIVENNTTKLIIEQKTQDLLIKDIPWNISVVKLPWHKSIFFVDW